MTTDQGYKHLAKQDAYTFAEAQALAREVWDAYGARAFDAPLNAVFTCAFVE